MILLKRIDYLIPAAFAALFVGAYGGGYIGGILGLESETGMVLGVLLLEILVGLLFSKPSEVNSNRSEGGTE